MPRNIVISVDAMGGDRGPAPVIDGMARYARKNQEIRYIVHGDETVLKPLIAKRRDLTGIVDVRHTEEVVPMEAKPSRVVRTGRNTSMYATLQTVEQGDATVAVSLGNTGALMALAMLRLRKAPGVDRPAIAVLWPSRNPSGYNVVLDVGADVRADVNNLVQFSIMGAEYARIALEHATPRIGLLNVGTEEHKGSSILHEAGNELSDIGDDHGLSYVGFVEGGDISADTVDVIVTDGFTGNVALKTAEGTATLIGDLLRNAFEHTVFSRIGALFAYTSLRRLSKRVDPRRVNGGVFLGLNGAVVKSHGGADATGVSAAIKLAFNMAKDDFSAHLASRIASHSPKDGSAAESHSEKAPG